MDIHGVNSLVVEESMMYYNDIITVYIKYINYSKSLCDIRIQMTAVIGLAV